MKGEAIEAHRHNEEEEDTKLYLIWTEHVHVDGMCWLLYVYTQIKNPEHIKQNTVIWKTAQGCKTVDT